jgi:hypothetical protein
MAKKKTAAEKRIAAAPASSFRKLTRTELEKLGLSPKSERFIEIGKRIARNTKTISKRLFTIKKTGVSPEARAIAHAEGELIYQSRKTQEAAKKQKQTREKQRFEKQLEKPIKDLTAKQIDRAAASFGKKASKVKAITPGINSTRERVPYRVRHFMRERMEDLYRRKLSGEFITDGDWHQPADFVQAANDLNLARIMQSKDDKRAAASGNEEIDMDEAA